MSNVARLIEQLDATRLVVALDIRHAHAHLAFPAAAELAAARGLDVLWLPHETRLPVLLADMPAGIDRGSRHRRLRAAAAEREDRIYAEAQGFRWDDQLAGAAAAADVGAIHRTWLHVAATRPAELAGFVGALLPAYRADTSLSGSAIASLPGASTGAAVTDQEAAAVGDALNERGAQRSPAYLLNLTAGPDAGQHLFLGRQHLPMIDYLLGQRTGAVPI